MHSSLASSTPQRQQLRDVFIFYCQWSEKHNYMYMSRTQFLRMCRDTMLMGPQMDAVALNLLFEKVSGMAAVSLGSPTPSRMQHSDCCSPLDRLILLQVHLESPDSNPGIRLSLADWLQALLSISAKIYSDCSPQEAFDKASSSQGRIIIASL
jgi:hypothetical protein